MRTVHPIILQRTLGISDTRFLLVSGELFAAGCFLICAETAALVRFSIAEYGVTLLWWTRYLGPIVVVVSGSLLWTHWHKKVTVQRNSCLEVELNSTRHRNFIEWMQKLVHRAALNCAVEIRYLPWREDANAYVTKRRDTFFITVTRGLVTLYRRSPDQAEAIVGHEISHIEADDIVFTNVARSGAAMNLVVIAGMNAALLTVYLVQVWLFGNSENGLPVAGALLTSAIAPIGGFLYYREYLLGREFMHDLRAVQIMNSSAPLEAYLSGLEVRTTHQSLWLRIMSTFQHFRAFHPTPEARIRNLSRLDPYRGWGFVTPVFAGAFLALLPIQLALAHAALQFPAQWLKISEWGLLAVTTLLLLKSDCSRLSVYVIHRDRLVIRMPAFFVLVLIGSCVAIFPFIALASAVRGHPLVASLQYASNGVLWTAIGYSGSAAFLAYVWGVYFLSNPRIWKALLGSLIQVFSIATITFFLVITLSRGETSFPLFPALVSWGVLSFFLGVLSILCGGCVHCGVRSWNALSLQNVCSSCGNARLPKSVLNLS